MVPPIVLRQQRLHRRHDHRFLAERRDDHADGGRVRRCSAAPAKPLDRRQDQHDHQPAHRQDDRDVEEVREPDLEEADAAKDHQLDQPRERAAPGDRRHHDVRRQAGQLSQRHDRVAVRAQRIDQPAEHRDGARRDRRRRHAAGPRCRRRAPRPRSRAGEHVSHDVIGRHRALPVLAIDAQAGRDISQLGRRSRPAPVRRACWDRCRRGTASGTGSCAGPGSPRTVAPSRRSAGASTSATSRPGSGCVKV